MTFTPDSPHPQHPHHLECPRCGMHTVVMHGENKYVCLNCNWQRDLNRIQLDDFPIVLAAIVTTLILLLSMFPRQPEPNLSPILPEDERPGESLNPTRVG
ncbi:hypothetical protein [Vacuolonema iberomarrocanum]|uniref:hypothetical protein n=1 Tax=Vacuolonema iberomarrocanum TaxID=3454632 RepID=UPI0019E9722E|nr:hypothetical protein [filamentous cyanobacterium LEGE 07170]